MLAASDSDLPVGLVLAEILPDGKSAEVLSIFVEQKYRDLGIGTSLPIRLEEELFSRGCKIVNLVYTTGKSTTRKENFNVANTLSNAASTRYWRCCTLQHWLSYPMLAILNLAVVA